MLILAQDGEVREVEGFVARGLAQVAEWAPRLVGVLVLLVAAWFVANWLRRIVYRALNRPRFDQTVVRFLSTTTRWVVLGLALVACLSVFGVAPTTLAAVVGAAGLAVGLAMQGSLSNLAAGIMLLLLRPFRVGDLIKINAELGIVDEIELFHTKLDTPDRRRLVVPNSQLFNSTIENITHNPIRRVDVAVGVEYRADIDRTREVLVEALRAVPQILADPAPEAFLLDLGASSVNWSVRGWAKREDFGIARQALTRAVKVHLDRAGISIPFPQTELWLRTPVQLERPGTEGPNGAGSGDPAATAG